MKIFARDKQRWSRPVNEDETLAHLSFDGGDIFCGIDKRHPDIYNQGFAPLINIKESKDYICKLCFSKFLKLKSTENETTI